MEALLKAQQEFADLMYKTVPGDNDDDGDDDDDDDDDGDGNYGDVDDTR